MCVRECVCVCVCVHLCGCERVWVGKGRGDGDKSVCVLKRCMMLLDLSDELCCGNDQYAERA